MELGVFLLFLIVTFTHPHTNTYIQTTDNNFATRELSDNLDNFEL